MKQDVLRFCWKLREIKKEEKKNFFVMTLFFSTNLSSPILASLFNINFHRSSIIGVFASISELTRIIATINKLSELTLNVI